MPETRVDQLADELLESLSAGELELITGGGGPVDTVLELIAHEAR